MGTDDDGTMTMGHATAPPRPLPAVVRALGAAQPPGSAQPAAFRLREGGCRIGADPECDLVITDKTVSRLHAELTLTPEGIVVTDLGSRNGTFYLDQRVERITLALGARLRLGAAEIVIEPDIDAFQSELGYGANAYHQMVGHSPAMRRVFALLERLEGSLATVLIEGESGVGKELVAQAVHHRSARKEGPFVAVNCGAVSRELVGSELFGHERGAFSGAVASRLGAFRRADGGTLFLDELGELPADVQPVLLRALETGEIQPVGADGTNKVSVRVIAATNRELQQDVDAGAFRSDLFYRLAVVRLMIPSLAERLDDVEPLARKFAADAGVPQLPVEVVEHLKAQRWPGNVRQLRNAVEAFVAVRVLPNPTPRSPEPGPDASVSSFVDLERPYLEVRDELVERFSQAYLAAMLDKTGQNVSQAARLAGLDRKYFTRLLARYRLR